MYFYLKEIINRFLISVSCFVKLYLKPRIPALTNNECPPGKKSGYMDCCKKNTITTHCPFIIFLWRWILLSISHFPELDEFKSQGKSSKIYLKSPGKVREKYLQKAVGTLYICFVLLTCMCTAYMFCTLNMYVYCIYVLYS